MVIRFTFASAKKKRDNIRAGWNSLRRLYRNAEFLLAPSATGFSLEHEAPTWPNALRLAETIVAVCDCVQRRGPAQSNPLAHDDF
jgi:hypothetical protein